MSHARHGKTWETFVENEEFWPTPALAKLNEPQPSWLYRQPSILLWRTGVWKPWFRNMTRPNKTASRNVQQARALCNGIGGGTPNVTEREFSMTTTFTNYSPTHKIHQNARTTNLPHKWNAPDKSSTLILCTPGTTVWNTRLTNWHTPYVKNAHENVWKNIHHNKPNNVQFATKEAHWPLRYLMWNASSTPPNQIGWVRNCVFIAWGPTQMNLTNIWNEESRMNTQQTQQQKQIHSKKYSGIHMCRNRHSSCHPHMNTSHNGNTSSCTGDMLNYNTDPKNDLPEMLFGGWNHSMWIAINFSSHPQSQKVHTKSRTTSSQ